MQSSNGWRRAIDVLRSDLAKIRSGRAHPALLDSVKVDYYGNLMPLSRVASINLLDSRTIRISPWEKKMLPIISKAIMASNLGLNPNSQDDSVTVTIPQLTEERRKELIKVAREEAEHARIQARAIRHEALRKLKGRKLSEDEEKRAQNDIQKFTDIYIEEINALLKAKEHELSGS